MMVNSSATSPGVPDAAQPVRKARESSAHAGAGPIFAREELPIVDWTVVDDLYEEVERSNLALNFVKDYVALWPQREHRFIASIEGDDRTEILDAIISVKVSSAMVGGLRLACLAAVLEVRAREDTLPDIASLPALISLHGRATVDELRRGLLWEGKLPISQWGAGHEQPQE